MKKEYYVINDGNKNITIYPLLEINNNNNHYIIYTKDSDTPLTKNDLYVGQIINDEILPVNENWLPEFQRIIDQAYEKIKLN